MTPPASPCSTTAGSTPSARSATSRTCAPRSPSGRDEGAVAVAEAEATIGLAHTRWATHGRVTEENAHPHSDEDGDVHIVLNGIVENHSELRRELIAEGHEFTSETDAEIVAHLIERHYDGDLTAAVRAAFADLRGHYAFVAMHVEHPEHARRRPPGVPAGHRRRRGGDLPRLGDPRLPARDPHRHADRERRDRHDHARRRRRSPTPTASRASARSRRSPGTRTRPSAAATPPS